MGNRHPHGNRAALATIVAAIALLIGSGFRYVGAAPTLIIGASAILALIAWLLTTYRRPATGIVPLYFAAVAALHLHILEEYATGFAGRMTALFNLQNFSESVFLVSFAFVGLIIWIIGGIGLLYENALANYLAWFLFIGPGFMEWTHYVFPLIEGGPYHYFPGMWTAWVPMLFSFVAMRRIWQSTRELPLTGSTQKASQPEDL